MKDRPEGGLARSPIQCYGRSVSGAGVMKAPDLIGAVDAEPTEPARTLQINAVRDGRIAQRKEAQAVIGGVRFSHLRQVLPEFPSKLHNRSPSEYTRRNNCGRPVKVAITPATPAERLMAARPAIRFGVRRSALYPPGETLLRNPARIFR